MDPFIKMYLDEIKRAARSMEGNAHWILEEITGPVLTKWTEKTLQDAKRVLVPAAERMISVGRSVEKLVDDIMNGMEE